MVLNFDLNYPPIEGSSASQVSSADSDSGNFGSPADVHLLDDDIQILSSPPPSLQWWQSRENHLPSTNLEANSERLPAEQGSVVVESVAVLSSFNGGHNNAQVYTNQQYCTNLMLFNPGGTPFEFQENINYILPTPPMSAPPALPLSSRAPMPDPPALSLSPRTPMPAPPAPPPPGTGLTFACPICLDVISNPCSTACGHIFCEQCIDASIKASVKQRKGRLCPNCRTKLPPRKSFHRVYLPKLN